MMKHRFIRAASVAAVVLAGLSSSAVMASILGGEEGPSFCDPEVSECTPTPSPTPSLPYLPADVSVIGNYTIDLGTVRNDGFQQGYIRDDQWTYFGGGAFRPIGGDNTLTVQGLSTSISMAQVTSPLASVTTIASTNTPQDPDYPDFSLVARGGISIFYVVKLHTDDQAAADMLSNYLSTSGAIASIAGDYSVNGTGSFWSSVVARTGFDFMDSSLTGLFYKSCSLIGYFGTPDQCGAGTYSVPLNFVNGSAFADGDGLDFYSLIQLDADANAGPVNLGYYNGETTAYIDPMISFSPDLDLSQFSLSVGGKDQPISTNGAVPEPASWAMMIAGLGLAGGALRRRSTRVAIRFA